MSNFHERLSELRKSRKMTQKELSDLLKVNVRTVQYYESGEKKPGFDVLVLLADAFGVTTDYLLGKSDDPTPPLRDNEPEIPPEDAAFYAWVKEHVTGMHFYDMHKARQSEEWLQGLRILYEKEKGRKPGQKQGE